MKKAIINLLFITIIFIVCIIIIHFLSISINILKYKDDNYYVVNKDKIPSIYSVIGKRKLYYYKSNNTNDTYIKTYKYKDIDNVKSDINNYIDYLHDNNNYVYTSDLDFKNDTGSVQLSTNSIDSKKIISIQINYNKNEYEIIITKAYGSINYIQD